MPIGQQNDEKICVELEKSKPRKEWNFKKGWIIVKLEGEG
jgi:hypothetical protein